jgi:6-phosphofructokinase 2
MDETVESIVTETKANTRENLVVLETASNQPYRFGMPGPIISEPEWQACLIIIENIPDVEYIVASNSLPKGVPTDILARIALTARKKNASLIVDTSGEALNQAVQAGVYLIKPNLGELSWLLRKEELNIELVDDAARKVIEKENCEVVVVSMGPAGAMLVTKELALQIMPPAVKRKSTVGAGDSMVAGMVLSLSNKIV